MRAAIGVLALCTLSMACATAPEAAPKMELPADWSAGARAIDTPPDAYWRSVTRDPVLQDLLTESGAVADVDIAAARAREAEAFARAARASLFPSLSASGTATASGADRGAGTSSQSAGLALLAPLDLFGAGSARAGAARARAEAAKADLALARLSARRTAGQLYAALRAAQASRAAAERQTRAAEDSLALAKARSDAGLESQLAVSQARTAADLARARIPQFAQAETSARLGLEALLGATPGALTTRLAPATMEDVASDALLDAPASVLLRRPDVRAADARLAAAGLDARAARADRWPTATLSASVTQTSASRAVDGASAVAGLSLAATLFDFGRLSALAEAAGARAEGEAAQYRRTVMFALADVERETDRLVQARREADANAAALVAAQDQAALARSRYTSGLSSFLDVLLAERAEADAEIGLAAARGRLTDAGVSLAAALGLGQEEPFRAGDR